MTDTLEIFPGLGVGPLVLGMNRDQVRAVMGEPESEETDDDFGDGSTMVSWQFCGGQIEADFSSDDDYRLGTITVSDPSSVIQGTALIGLTEEAFLEAAKKAGIGPIELDDEFEDIDARDFAWEDRNVTFWVSDGVLENMSIMPRYDPTGEVPQWPPLP